MRASIRQTPTRSPRVSLFRRYSRPRGRCEAVFWRRFDPKDAASASCWPPSGSSGPEPSRRANAIGAARLRRAGGPAGSPAADRLSDRPPRAVARRRCMRRLQAIEGRDRDGPWPTAERPTGSWTGCDAGSRPGRNRRRPEDQAGDQCLSPGDAAGGRQADSAPSAEPSPGARRRRGGP